MESKKEKLEEKTTWEYVNKALRSMEWNSVRSIFQAIVEQTKGKQIHWISVGSGNGVMETFLEDIFDIKVFKIDPNPHEYIPIPKSFAKQYDTYRNHYVSLESCMKEFPELEKNCILLLNWCYPNNSCYDSDAIETLKPLYCISICEVTSGTSGGSLFHSWFRNSIIEKEKNEKIKQSLKDNCYPGLWDKVIKKKEYSPKSKYCWRGGNFYFGKDELNLTSIVTCFVVKKNDFIERGNVVCFLDPYPFRSTKQFSWVDNTSPNHEQSQQVDFLLTMLGSMLE